MGVHHPRVCSFIISGRRNQPRPALLTRSPVSLGPHVSAGRPVPQERAQLPSVDWNLLHMGHGVCVCVACVYASAVVSCGMCVWGVRHVQVCARVRGACVCVMGVLRETRGSPVGQERKERRRMRATGNSEPCRFRSPKFTPFAAKREKSQCLPLTSGKGSTAALWSSLRSPAGDRGGRRAVFAAAAVAEPPRTVTCSAPEYGMRVGLQWPGTSSSAQGRSPAVCAGWGVRGRNGLRVCGSCGEWRGLGRSQGAHRVPLNDHGHVPSSAAQPAVSPLPHLPLDVGGLRGEVHIPGFPGHPRRELCLQPAISLFLMDVRLAGGHTKGRDLTRFLAWDRYRPPQLSLALGSRAQAATGSGLGPPG